MRGRRGRGLLLALLALTVPPLPASAVDRSLGAAVAKPADAGAAWTRREKRRLARDVDALLDGAPTLLGAHVGLLAVDARSGDVLYARRADDAFLPASTLKLVTGSAALALLGPAFRFRTAAYAVRQTLRGQPQTAVVVRAGGDPLLSSSDVVALARSAAVSDSREAPYVVSIDRGAFDVAPYPPGWSWDDFPYAYAAKLTPLPIDENAAELTVAPGGHAGDPLDVRAGGAALLTEVCRDPAVLARIPAGVTGAPDTPADIDVVRDPALGCLSVVGSLPAGGGPQTLDVALGDPTASVYRLILRTLLGAAAGDPVPGIDHMSAGRSYETATVPAGARLVWSHAGEPLSDLLADMWWPSDNFVAEMLLRAIGSQRGGSPGTTERGVAAERTWMATLGVNPATLTLVDGSGLSSYDRLTPRALVAVLQADWNGPKRELVLDDLPLAGVRGTLAHSFLGSPAELHTFGKTGSMNHTRGLAGYLATLRHGAVTFAWSVDDWMGVDADLDALRSRVLARFITD